ncbi:MAG: bifunctional alpha/beta hydrolase/OsmC family protein [Caulobacterales bacterium]|nr:bifunctional alpha/beta hydrolase/OsmC family protein [Caulobacterales bacterium]
MAITTERIEFEGGTGARLAARLDRPRRHIRAYALFAHCFTCSKDVFAANRISRRLAEHDIAVLRFDFTGLGASEGDFANTNFSSNIEDLLAAVEHMRRSYAAPALMIGHSLGGAATLMAAARTPEAQAVVTIAAPADAAHVTGNFAADVGAIEAQGEAEVTLGGRSFTIRRQFLDDLGTHSVETAARELRAALLVCQAPLDQTVGIGNASRIFAAAKHPKSFLSLDGADHLLTRREDAEYAADVIAAWAARYVGGQAQEATPPEPASGPNGVAVRETRAGRFQNHVVIGDHVFFADEPERVGGNDTGPTPYELLNAALGTCTAMTMRMYADRKSWPLERVTVTLNHEKGHAEDCAHCDEDEKARVDIITRELTIEGPLDDEQITRLVEIADKCPVHRTLHSPVVVRTSLVSPPSALKTP